MPGLSSQRKDRFLSNANSTSYYSLSSNTNGTISSSNGFWSQHRDDASDNQLQKFWDELSGQARQNLVRIDKQTLFERARKNMYCSRCNGLLLEGFMQIVMYGKSLQHDGTGGQVSCNGLGMLKNQIQGGLNTASVCRDETKDPSCYPWGGLTVTRDGALTLLDCYLYSKSLKDLQNVFDSARARERERELLYPDACGGGGRGWISQGIASYGRGHGTRETCALHTARLSCDTLVDFWSALGEDTRQSLLRMKEEDFIERLMYRFDSKRFCRDCRRNVIREFKELKELKRMRWEPWCTSWFCVADTAFHYEVSNDTIRADWRQTFIDSIGLYAYFEWTVGSKEGEGDIVELENVGMNVSAEVNGLDLGGLNACYVTLNAWKRDGRCNTLTVKAHALKGRQCVHCRLVVGDGYVTITRGEGIKRFFEHAEEAEEEEDDDSVDKDGNDLDGECSRPQKHAKSPELAREFLLDAATVIFKEQVEKAFREGTARQNAHSIFVCLALKLLEDRIHIACKEIITFEKQVKLLEEEEKEKQEEEERKERKRAKEKEKKLRRKERLRGKDSDKTCSDSIHTTLFSNVIEEVSSTYLHKEADNSVGDLVSETGESHISESVSPDVLDESSSNGSTSADLLSNGFDGTDGESVNVKEGSGLFELDSLKGSGPKSNVQRDLPIESSLKCSDRHLITENGVVIFKSEPRYYDDSSENPSKEANCFSRHLSGGTAKLNFRNSGAKFNQKVQCSSNRMIDRFDQHSCGCNQQNDNGEKVEPHLSRNRFSWDTKSFTKIESATNMSKLVHHGNKFNQTEHVNMRESSGRHRNKTSNYSVNALGRDSLHSKKVWEPVEPQKRYSRSNSESDVTLRSCTSEAKGIESDRCVAKEYCGGTSAKLSGDPLVNKLSTKFRVDTSFQNGFHAKDATVEEVDVMTNCSINRASDFSARSSSSSDNCSSCLSEGDSNTPSSRHPSTDSSSTSDSEDSSQPLEEKQSSLCGQVGLSKSDNVEKGRIQSLDSERAVCLTQPSIYSSQNVAKHVPQNSQTDTSSHNAENGKIDGVVASEQQGVHPSSIHNPNIPFPVYQAPSTVGYYHQNPMAWSTAPGNGFMMYPHANPYCLNGPFGYGLSVDSHLCMQYAPVQHLASPFMNNDQIPMYHQPPLGSNWSCPADHTNGCKPIGANHSSEEHKKDNASLVVDMTKPKTGNKGFSLFQFGGPVALPTYKSSLQCTGDISMDDDHDSNKNDTTIEEYNLFATRNGIQFSIL